MKVDLHTHSAVSDGTDTPAALMAKAAASGIDVVALTDHDTSAGWVEATQAAAGLGLTLVRGMELSTLTPSGGQHLLAYEPDPSHPGLVDVLERGQASREGRLGQIIARLGELDIHITAEAVAAAAGGGTSGRPHIADAMIAAGYVPDREAAFSRYLKRGAPASVLRWAPEVGEAVSVVAAAGGVPVLAHPWGRGQKMEESEFARLAWLGLAGIEVDHQEHDAAQRDALRGIAANLGLLVTGSSDHHGTGKVDHDLGCNTTAPEVYEEIRGLIEFEASRRGSNRA